MICLDYNSVISDYEYDTSYSEDYYKPTKLKNNPIDLLNVESFLPILVSYKCTSIGLQKLKRKKEDLLKKFISKSSDFSELYVDSCLNYKKTVNPIPVRVICNEVLDMDEKSYDEELFSKAYESILQDAQDISTVETKNFIEHCETVYNMSSKEFMEIYEKKNGEVNVEQQLWAMIIRNQSEVDI